MKNTTAQNITRIYKDNLEQMGNDFDECCEVAKFVPFLFGGKAAVYYHHKALLEAETKSGFLKDDHLTMIREVLKAWGMESRGAELPKPRKFNARILKYAELLTDIKSKHKSKSID